MTKLDDLIQQIEAEAEAEGPGAVAEYHQLRTRFRLAHELRAARLEKGLTQTELAQLTEIGQPEISKIESGDSNPTVSTLDVLFAALDLDLYALRPAQVEALATA